MKYHYDANGNVTKRTCSKCGGQVFYNVLHTCEGEAARQRYLAARAELMPARKGAANGR